jgi:uncharacterized membrane protein YeiB
VSYDIVINSFNIFCQWDSPSGYFIVFSIKLAKTAGPSKWLELFLSTAQMSLTLYIFHIAVFQLFLLVSGLSSKENSLEFAWVLAAIFCLLAIPFSYFWVNHFERGPFEKIVRWVSR